ncbi:MAG: hypothetical protein WA159_21075 [Variovorax sp.]
MSLSPQRGWLLADAAVATALLALLMVIALNPVATFRHQNAAREERRELADAEYAITGFALANFHLPAPLDARNSAFHPDYLEGWIPSESLGLQVSAQRIRYLVHGAMSQTDMARYEPDPLRLTREGQDDAFVVRRSSDQLERSVLDLCVALVRKALDEPQPGRMALAFGLSQDDVGSQASPFNAEAIKASIGEAFDAQAPGNAHSRFSGVGEVIARLGCVDRLGRVSIAVRETAASLDHLRLGFQEREFRDLALRAAEDALSIASLKKEIANVQVVISVAQLKLAIATAKGTTLGAVRAAADLSAFTLLTTNAGMAATRSADAERAADTAKSSAAEARRVAARRIDQLRELVRISAAPFQELTVEEKVQ